MTNGFVPSPPQQPTQPLPLDYAPLAPPLALDHHVRRGQEEYAFGLAALLPQGIAWPRWSESTFMKVVYGLAGIMGWADGRAADLLERESDPRQTTEMLDSWETAWGLPEPCLFGKQFSVAERRNMLVMKMTLLGAQSREFFTGVAAWLGYPITITEYRPFMVGVDRCGDSRSLKSDGTFGDWPCQIGDPLMRFAWTIHIAQTKLVWFRAGSGQAGIDPHLRIARAEDLECIIRRWSPAHSQILFDYSGISDPFAGTDRYYLTVRAGDYIVTRSGEQIVSGRAGAVIWQPPFVPFAVGSPTFGTPSLIVSMSPPDVATQAWLNTVALRGGVVTNRQTVQTDLLIKGLKYDGLWPILDRVWLGACESNEAVGTVDIVNNGILTNVVGLAGPCTWTLLKGFRGDGQYSYLNSNFNPATALTPNFKANNGCIGAWINVGQYLVQKPNNYIIGVAENYGTYIDVLDSTGDNLYYFALNDQIGTQYNFSSSGAPIGAVGPYLAVDRSGQAASTAYCNGVQIQFSSNPSASTTFNSNILFGRASPNTHYFSSEQFGIMYIAKSLTARQHALLYNRFRNYLTGMGQNPGTPYVPT